MIWFWLGLDDGIIDLMGSIQFMWKDGFVYISEDILFDEALRICTLIFAYMSRVASFSTSRWCGVAQSSRHLVACTLIGMPSLIDYVLASKRKGIVHLKGWSHFGPEVKPLVAISSVSSVVAERVSELMMKDNRLARRVHYYLSEMNDAVAAVHNVW